MKITSLQHYQEIMSVRKVRVERNTYSPGSNSEALIGKTVEVWKEDFKNKEILVWNEDKSDWWVYNKSDVTEMFPALDYKFGFGDKVQAYGYDGEYTVIGISVCGKGLCLNCMMDNDITNIYSFDKEETLTLISPTTETITIGGNKYSKQEVEDRLKDLKPVV